MSKMNKKGYVFVGSKSLFFIFAVIVLIAMAFWLVFLLGSFRTAPLDVYDDAYINIYTERFLGSPECFAYIDINTGNVYSGVIDLNKFNSERLNSCYLPNEKSKYEFFLTLQYEGNEIKLATENYKVITKQTLHYVLIWDGAQIKKGKMLVGVSIYE